MTNSIPPIPKPITTQHTVTTAFNLVYRGHSSQLTKTQTRKCNKEHVTVSLKIIPSEHQLTVSCYTQTVAITIIV